MQYRCPDPCGLSCRPIPSSGPESHPDLMIVGEAPGKDEEKQGKFFVGKAGQELTNYLFRIGVDRYRCYITNVLKCRPPDNRDPRQTEIKCCEPLLRMELNTIRPRYIAAVGRYASRWFLGDVDMETVHGIPFTTDYGVVIPVYHPSAGLHDTANMSIIMSDFMAVRDVATGVTRPRTVGGDVSHGVYCMVPKDQSPLPFLDNHTMIAIDTETQDEGKAWCISICADGNQGYVIMSDDHYHLRLIQEWVSNKSHLVVLHNSMFDLPILSQMGITPVSFTDTMVMAYLLQTEPQGLKQLSFRHLGMKMRTYEEMVGEATQYKALAYLSAVASREWPRPQPVLEELKGVWRLRQPQPINKKAARAVRDWERDNNIDLIDRWNKMGGKEDVERELGILTPAYLKDLPLQDAVDYAGEDALSTWHIYHILFPRIKSMGLLPTLNRDLAMIPMVIDMQETGILVDKDYFTKLRTTFTNEMDNLRVQISQHAGKDINPGSDQQVLDVLYRLKLVKSDKLRRGSVDRARLEEMAHMHPVIPLISEWRGYSKLISSFINVIPAKTGKDGRVRTTLRVTRVVTGRLSSSSPNLMAQPTRTETGRQIRGGFIAQPGCVIVSMDYSQIEMRCVAHLAKDPVMISVFKNNEDIHLATACRMFGVPPDQIDEMKHRYPAKRVGFGILNLISPEKLLRELTLGGAEGWTVPKCQQLIHDWFGVYEGIASWIEEKKSEARRTGMVRDMWGRMRLVPEVMSIHPQIVEAGIRQAVNAPIQMSAQGVIKEAMGKLIPLYKGFRDAGVVLNPLIQIHDDLLTEMQEDMISVIIPMYQHTMESCVPWLTVPLKVDTKVGTRWSDLKKWRTKK